MSADHDLIKNLTMLNKIAETLNQAVDVGSALNSALVRLLELMGLETGWIFLVDSGSQNRWFGKGYTLVAHHNLPPALALDKSRPWKGNCDCQSFCQKGKLAGAYNEVRCSRLLTAPGDRRGLVMHASVPLRSGEHVLGIMNVAGPDWTHFSAEALALLTNVGNQMGIALERARLFDLLREQRVHEQAALLDLSNRLLGETDLDSLICCLVEEVQRLLQADACALLLPDGKSDSLIFRAASGWRFDPVAAQRRVPADSRSGSGLVMETQEPLLVEDQQTNDPTPWTANWITAEGFRSHAVVPLVVEGRSIGVLMVDTRRPRRLTEDEVRFLCLMANQAAIAIEKARLHQEALNRQRLEEEMAVGRQIQFSLLPEACPLIPGWELAAFYQPARQVGGDFYDFFDLPGEPNRLGMVIADVADKGVAAALFMALSRSIIRGKAIVPDANPAAVLKRANRLILKDSRARLFVTACYAVLNTLTGSLTYSLAGHNRPLWWQADTQLCVELTGRGTVLGIFDEVELEEHTVTLAPSDVLVFYTDGIIEAMDSGHRLFGEKRLQAVICEHAAAGPQEIIDAIIVAVQSFTGGGPPSDDLTLFVVKRH
ncbi:MAG: GAF domain-containing SpoIIE family protein phosphatase [Anaerolineae bacterium]